MDMTELSPITVLFAVVAMAGIFVFFSRAESRWSRLAVRIISAASVVFGCVLLAFLFFRGKPVEHVVELRNGAFKILVRSQEFAHSGTQLIEICVAETSSGSFPQSESQCFFRGFDFSGLSVAWQSERDIEVSFRSGYLTRFQNTASVIPRGTYVPEGFHTIVRDGESETAGRALSRLVVEF
jgi:hypothetical protein